ncbi:MAG: hypothetical protein UT86_C0004G0023 [Candidatus Magasanikbacteria bacterium GW2011_GWC2_40_17]|uniref:STAS/SEC14 domain-containing protein n=1 Tax=Candidatus Magasanikbacteria bacterium GW2011_GWA2_42_32 TaxID=1619039 RepID=A0A0G1D4X5_9BACT|nr:MAG: hypothetical protein UT86_C0004G0023 [Candidatus Magasanikbacteria bacterium GW2011_GWC2_40_17]KKS57083.1 MAG: hypothetical protein UV20_C0003G0023 [Candidatus Magasanikbacteria bacterium GW2011_GWA2_42_32]OGH85392.1 MAG: hypothetical protein A2294_01350 [Candidatus Magasanikbacteria bacterium RIFOXYB2_FULL_38_10]
MVKDIKEKKFEVKWDENLKIMRVKIIGNQIGEDADAMFKAIVEQSTFVFQKDLEPVKILIDISKAGKMDREAIEIHSKYFKFFKIGKVAFLGADFFRKTIVASIYTLAGHKDYKFFDEEKKAVEWLTA